MTDLSRRTGHAPPPIQRLRQSAGLGPARNRVRRVGAAGIAVSICAGCALLTLALLNHAVDRGLVTGNASPSVPRGIYVREDPETAAYVSFCLGTRHMDMPFAAPFCTPDRPDAPRILKRISHRYPDGRLVVEGDSPRALDSRFLGTVEPEDIRGWWQPLLLIDREDPNETQNGQGNAPNPELARHLTEYPEAA